MNIEHLLRRGTEPKQSNPNYLYVRGSDGNMHKVKLVQPTTGASGQFLPKQRS